jgi:hypothetical protein
MCSTCISVNTDNYTEYSHSQAKYSTVTQYNTTWQQCLYARKHTSRKITNEKRKKDESSEKLRCIT